MAICGAIPAAAAIILAATQAMRSSTLRLAHTSTVGEGR
jgi:hypothetical protein